MSDYIWETFDGLFKTVYRQDKRVEALEQRIVELERRLHERPASRDAASASVEMEEFPFERAA